MTMMKAVSIALASVALWLPMESSAAGDTSSVQLQEIVVTAQKRVEDVQRVPISVSVTTRRPTY
jgi:outer membrane receptor protein involved in Fe transport